MVDQDLRGCSGGYLRSIGGYANTQKQKGRWVGPAAGARFLEGDMEALRVSLCWSEKEPLVFPVSQRDGQ